MTGTSAQLDERGIGIVGVGLIGGSIAACLKKIGYSGPIVGFGRNKQRLRKAQSLGLLDRFSSEASPKLDDLSLIIICTPVDRIVDDVKRFAEVSQPGTIITDAGSVKAEICQNLLDFNEGPVTFLGAHPLAGSEKNGFEFANADLYQNRICFITPRENTPDDTFHRVQMFWAALGMQLKTISPSEHDHLMSVTSHAPHLIAAAVTMLLDDESAPFTGSGFQDTTRIASGDPGLWRAIALQNRESLSKTLTHFVEILNEFSSAIEAGDGEKIQQFLELAKTRRDSLV